MKREGISIPLKAKINEEIVFGPDIPSEKWFELKKLQRKKGFCVTMICCNSPGHLRNSKKGLQFFYHKIKPSSCSWEPESHEHEDMKYAIYRICRDEGWDVFTEYQSPDNNWRADVLAVKNGRKIVFEIQFSKISQTNLQDREQKYSNAGIESYWLLKDFFGHSNVNYWDVLTDKQQFPEDVSFMNDPDFLLKLEKDYFIMKNIRAIGIDDSNEQLFSSEAISLSLEDWVKSCLTGEYSNYLKKCALAIKQKVEQFEKWRPILENIEEKTTTLHKLQKKVTSELQEYCLYSSREDMQKVWSLLEELHTHLIQIIDRKNLYYLKKGKKLDSSLINFNNELLQIEDIRTLLKEYSKSELKFSQFLHEIVKEAQSKYNKSGDRFKIIKEEKPKKDTMNAGQKVIFQFSHTLPLEKNWLIASSGNKYQYPVGWKIPIIEPDAIEFQKKGYGKIVEEYVRVPDK